MFGAFGGYATATGLTVQATAEEQNSDYGAGVIDVDGGTWHIRTARITPTKPGAFVAFWTRNLSGQTEPFSVDNCGAGLLLFVDPGQDGLRGVFEFTADHLDRLGVVTGRHAGKRGFRVYPDWCTDLNRQATATQRAQAPAFRRY